MLATGLNNSHVLLLMAQHEGPTHRCFVSITVEKHDYVASIFYSLVHERHLDTGFQPGFLPMWSGWVKPANPSSITHHGFYNTIKKTWVFVVGMLTLNTVPLCIVNVDMGVIARFIKRLFVKPAVLCCLALTLRPASSSRGESLPGNLKVIGDWHSLFKTLSDHLTLVLWCTVINYGAPVIQMFMCG